MPISKKEVRKKYMNHVRHVLTKDEIQMEVCYCAANEINAYAESKGYKIKLDGDV